MWRPRIRPRKAWRAPRQPQAQAECGAAVLAAFAARAASRRSFFFGRKVAPRLFGIEGLEGPKDFPRLAAAALSEARQELSGVAERPPLELVTALDNASNGLCRIADAAELCRNVHPDKRFVDAASEAVGGIAGYMGEVNLDSSIHAGMLRAEAMPEFRNMDFETSTVLRHMRESMEHEGVHLPEAEKAECLQLLAQEQELSFDIVQRQAAGRGGAEEDVGAWVPADGVRELLGDAGLRRLQKRKLGGSAEEVRVPLAWAEPVLKHAVCPETRRRVFEASQTPDARGEEDMAQLLLIRQRIAGIRGYRTWNHYAQREALLNSPERVGHFLDAAWESLRPGVEQDLRRLAAEKERLGLGSGRLEPWDLPMLLHTSRQQHEQESRISEYLTYGSLMTGVDLILSRLLGLAFIAEEPGPGEVWHPSVQKYTLREAGEKGRMLGVLYLDPFMRDGKNVQSAQFTLQGSKILGDGGRQIPVTTLVYSLPVGAEGLPVSLAVTFMHEIGHALHSLLSETSLQHLSGTRGTVDFVEFPSHLFEHFVLDPDCLALYASHAKTGKPLPSSLKQSYRDGRAHFGHFEAVQQLAYATMDQAFYSCLPGEEGASAVQRHLSEALSRFDREFEGPFNGPFSHLLGLSRTSKFDHLIHYGGSYYCYLFNRALSAHVWQHGFGAEPFAPEAGGRLRELLRGGSVVQSLPAIEALCPGAGGFRAEDVPFDALAAQLQGA